VHEHVLGRATAPADRVFLSPEGSRWPQHTVNCMRIFDRLLEAAGIAREDAHGGKLDIHALRHTAATRLARAGVGLAQAQRILGHSDPKLTAKIYTHVGVDELRDAVDRLPSTADQAKRVGA
jgi:integrase